MERYIVRLAFWAGFGQAMAITMLTLVIAEICFDLSTANTLSVVVGAVTFTGIGVFWGFDRAMDLKRRWNGDIQ